MANPYKTGRTQTCVWGGSLTGATQTAGPGSIPGTASGDTGSTMTIICQGFTLSANGFSKYDFGASSTLQVSIAAPDGYTNSQEVFDGDGTGPSSSISMDGSWQVSADCEEWAEIYTPSASTTINGSPFPNFGGAAIGDGLPSIGILFYQSLRPGGTLSGSITSGSVTLSHAITIGSATTIGYLINATAVCEASGGDSNTTSIGLNYQGTGISTSYDQSQSYGGGTMSVNALGGACTASVNSQGGCGINAIVNPPISFTLNGRLRTFGSVYPGAATVTWNKLAGSTATLTPMLGSFSDSVVQNNWACTSYWNNGTDVAFPSGSLNQWQAPAIWLSNLSGALEDTRDWRMQFSGFKWDALSLSRASSVLIDSCGATTQWTAGANTSLSVVGGELVATVSGGVGSLSLAVPHALRVWEVYRYLQIIGSFDPGGSTPTSLPLTLALAGQSWSLVFSQTSSSQQLDLCCATSDTTTVGATQSRFPIVAPGGFPINTDPTHAYELGWGVNFCDSLTISGIPDGYSLTLAGVSLVTSTDPETQSAVTLLENFQNLVAGWTDPTDNTSVQPWLYMESDGRPIDVPALALVVPTGSSPPTYTWYTISQIQTILAYYPGLTATLLATPTDTYHGPSLWALLLGGEGATYDWTALAWKDWVDVSLPQTIPAQDLFDEVQGYPGMGQVWTESGAFGTPTPLVVSKSLRGQAWGLAFTAAGLPLVGAPVSLYETSSPGVSEGSGSCNDLGYFLTGSPWAYGNVDSTIDLNVSPIPHLTTHGVIQNRQRFRGAFRHAPVVTQGLGYDVSTACRHVRLYLSSTSGTVGMRCAGNVLPQSWTDVDTGIAAIWARPRFADQGLTWPIGMFYGDGSNCFWARSYDEGTTWQDTTAMGAGLIGDFEEGANGLRWFFKIQDDSGVYNVYGRLMDAQLHVVRDWAITNVTSIDNQPIACRESPVSDGSWRIGLLFSLAGVETILFSNDGLIFS